MLRLTATKCFTGTGGAPLATFAKSDGEGKLPVGKMKQGALVGIFDTSTRFKLGDELVMGLVHEISKTHLTTAIRNDFNPIDEKNEYNVALLSDDTVYSQYRDALNNLRANPHHPVVQACFSQQFAEFGSSYHSDNLVPSASLAKLNDSQKDAVASALNSVHVAAIHGPPGTGKTSTLVALIIQQLLIHANRGDSQQILICAPAHSGVDNLAKQLLKAGVDSIVRLGHTSKIDREIVAHSLADLVDQTDEGQRCISLMQRISRMRKDGQDVRDLQREYKSALYSIQSRILSSKRVILSTCTGVSLLKEFSLKVSIYMYHRRGCTSA